MLHMCVAKICVDTTGICSSLPPWIMRSGAALVVMFVVAPLTGSGFLCLKLGFLAPAVVALFHLSYGAILGGIYGKLLDTDEAREITRYARH